MKPNEEMVKNLLQSISSPQPSKRMKAKQLILALGEEILGILDEFSYHNESGISRSAARAFNWIHEQNIIELWRDYRVSTQRQNVEFGALLIAQAEYPSLDTEMISRELDLMAAELKRRVADISSPVESVHALNEHFFGDLGFCGNTEDYYDPQNSFLPDILERRTGIPITLSLVYLAIAERAGMKLHGIGMPGHFMVRLAEDPDFFIDVFHGGQFLTGQDCADMMRTFRIEFSPRHLSPISPKDIYIRMLRNLVAVYHRIEMPIKAKFALEQVFALENTSPVERYMHASICAELGESDAAIEDLRILQSLPEHARQIPRHQLLQLATRLIAGNN
ncbi:MAG: transglutaminase-like domain-containing protein [Planctomycetota bacterium]|jgi:regulator of sirC expression with transglutaminase-like and TPR domain|nr:transglutaminase-like domain-containing protein [Planctomycetota bacterium]MDP6504726.1 transglutaminase-like domain-containing protein [Planctomycetota bacterium]